MAVNGTCYLPNGQPLGDPKWQPCPPQPGKKFSMCCFAPNLQESDHCQRNALGEYTGLCLGADYTGLFRNSCTDRHWGPDCLKLCVDGKGVYRNDSVADMRSRIWPITDCGNATFCCSNGEVGKQCCSEGNGYSIVNVSL